MGSRGSVMWLLEALLGRGIPAVARGVAGSDEIDAPLGLELPFAIARVGLGVGIPRVGNHRTA
jgi:hypothetical protein